MGEQPQRLTRGRQEGVRIERVTMAGASLRLVDLGGARLHNVSLRGARMTGMVLADAVIDGDIDGLVINGVSVAPLIEAELDRQEPDRRLMRPGDATGYAVAWRRLGQLWDETIARAVALDRRRPGALHQRVGGEWSFLETLRHLIFVIDAWVLRVYLGRAEPYHRWAIPHEEEQDNPQIPVDLDANPSVAEVIDAFTERWRQVSGVYAELTDEDLAGITEPVQAPGYPPAHAYPVDRVLTAVLSEAWEHRRFAERDLGILEASASSG